MCVRVRLGPRVSMHAYLLLDAKRPASAPRHHGRHLVEPVPHAELVEARGEVLRLEQAVGSDVEEVEGAPQVLGEQGRAH